MCKRLFLLSSVIASALFHAGCGGEAAENPIVAGGELPSLVAGLPEGDYLAVGYLDAKRALDSAFGRFLLDKIATRFPLVTPFLGGLTASPAEAAFATRFDAGPYPKLYEALPTILVARIDLDPNLLLLAMRAGDVESFEMEGIEVRSYDAALPVMPNAGGRAFIAKPEGGLLVLATSRKLLEEYLQVRKGSRSGLSAGGAMSGLLKRADKTAPAWLAARQTPETRAHLKILPPFEELLAAGTVDDSLNLLWVFDFEQVKDAENYVKTYQFTRHQMQRSIEKFKGKLGEEIARSEEFFSRMEASREGNLAVFRFELTEELASFFFEPAPETESPATPAPGEEPGGGGEEQ